MEAIRRYFKEQLPGYLKALPIPKTLGGFANLSRDQWIELLPVILFLFILFYLMISPLLNYYRTRPSKQPRPRINLKYQLEKEKASDEVLLDSLKEELTNNSKHTVSYCRCWKSATFPYCDGSHNKHNRDTGDNVAPIKIKLHSDLPGKEEKESKKKK